MQRPREVEEVAVAVPPLVGVRLADAEVAASAACAVAGTAVAAGAGSARRAASRLSARVELLGRRAVLGLGSVELRLSGGALLVGALVVQRLDGGVGALEAFERGAHEGAQLCDRHVLAPMA